MTEQFSDADRLGCEGVGGRPKSNPVLEAIRLAKWEGYRSGLPSDVADDHNVEIAFIRSVYLRHHPQGPEVAGRTTSYYVCSWCKTPIDMDGTGLDGLVAPVDGREFERASQRERSKTDNMYFHNAIGNLENAHNADRAADKQRIAELGAQLAEWETRLSAVMPKDMKCWHQNSKKEWPEVAALVIENLKKEIDDFWAVRVLDFEAQVKNLKTQLFEPDPHHRQQIAEMRRVISQCANQFRYYESLHNSKGPIGAEKARRNAELAEECEKALRHIAAAQKPRVMKRYVDEKPNESGWYAYMSMGQTGPIPMYFNAVAHEWHSVNLTLYGHPVWWGDMIMPTLPEETSADMIAGDGDA